MIAARLAIVLLALSSAASHADDIVSLADGVRSGLLWESRWYGHFFGQRCLQQAAQRGAAIRAVVTPVEKNVGFRCSTGSSETQVVPLFQATVEGSGIFLRGEIAEPVLAEISDGESNSDCTLTEDDLIKQADELKRAGIAVPLRDLVEMDKEFQPSARLQAFAARSVALWARRANLSEPRTIRIGPLTVHDPFLVVGVGATQLLLRVPDAAQLESPDFCARVFSPHRFAGRHAEHALRTEGIAHLARRLERLGSEMPLLSGTLNPTAFQSLSTRR